MEVSGAALKTIARWAEEGERFVVVTLHDHASGYVAGWEAGDILATQGDAHIHVDVRGLVKETVPDHLSASRVAAG
jgi:hypothetical protein